MYYYNIRQITYKLTFPFIQTYTPISSSIKTILTIYSHYIHTQVRIRAYLRSRWFPKGEASEQPTPNSHHHILTIRPIQPYILAYIIICLYISLHPLPRGVDRDQIFPNRSFYTACSHCSRIYYSYAYIISISLTKLTTYYNRYYNIALKINNLISITVHIFKPVQYSYYHILLSNTIVSYLYSLQIICAFITYEYIQLLHEGPYCYKVSYLILPINDSCVQPLFTLIIGLKK